MKKDQGNLKIWNSKLQCLNKQLNKYRQGLDRLHRIRSRYGECLMKKLADKYVEAMGKKIGKTESQIRKFLMYKKMGKGEWNEKVDIDIETIKEIPIGDLIGIEPTGRSGGRVYYGCPLHNEVNGSFVWYKKNNSFYCFGCGEGGDNIALVMKLNDCSFKQAINMMKF